MRRYAPRPSSLSYAFGPGPVSPAVKWIIIANVVMFLISMFVDLTSYLGLVPQQVVERGWLWQLATYMFLHGGAAHILFNMLGIWMFGTELERLWGTQFFTRFYALTGVGAGLTVLAVGLLPFEVTRSTYYAATIGASGALYGLLMAFAIYYPDRPILMFLLFPVPAKYFVVIVGALAFLAGPGGDISNAAHLGGLIFGYFYLRGGRGGLTAELKYRYLKWKMNRLRRKFDVYSGGRSDWDRHVH
ncbi:MAG TPA: rhomboid family intramembrane serine protease [Vicinamibacterales bacterium]|jgi:membrane associated rhomboid family serine protease|nr:rhomboid family intramembrane serine protease [Vicinamibacterales bacterium]